METNYSCEAHGVVSAARWLYNYPGYDNMTDDDIQEWILNPSEDVRQEILEPRQYDDFYFFFNPGMAETGQSYIYRSFFYAGLI